jgi:AbrB family looped-hinge helix DNA binding protein
MEKGLEITRISSKGQIVLPKSIRSKLHIKKGTLFAMQTSKKLILLKMIDDPIVREDIDALESAEKAWKQLEEGKYTKYTKDAFLKRMAAW